MAITRRTALQVAASAAAAAFLPHAFADDAPLNIALLSASSEYKSDESLASLAEELEKNYRIKCTRVFGKDGGNDALPGLEAIDIADVMLVFTRRLRLPADQLARIKKYCEAGKPVVGLRTASHAFQDWLEFDKLVLGGNYQNHYKSGATIQVSIADKAKGHPILAGVSPFTSLSSLYKNTPISPDSELLLTGVTPDTTEPLAWTHIHKEGRVFYTSLGSPDDFKNPDFRRLVINGLLWTSRRDLAKIKPE